jgi:ABC-type transport system substrate-binding protein
LRQKSYVITPCFSLQAFEDMADGRQKITFTLRQGVKFHDSEEWNAAAAKANFDHVLHPALVTDDFHGWYVSDRASSVSENKPAALTP